MRGLYRYESNTTWTGQIGVKTEKIWPNEDSGNFVNRWNLIFEFKINKNQILNQPRTVGVINKKNRGYLE